VGCCKKKLRRYADGCLDGSHGEEFSWGFDLFVDSSSSVQGTDC
jgi:hypothetical protein